MFICWFDIRFVAFQLVCGLLCFFVSCTRIVHYPCDVVPTDAAVLFIHAGSGRLAEGKLTGGEYVGWLTHE